MAGVPRIWIRRDRGDDRRAGDKRDRGGEGLLGIGQGKPCKRVEEGGHDPPARQQRHRARPGRWRPHFWWRRKGQAARRPRGRQAPRRKGSRSTVRGAGNDTLNSVDKRKDALVSGGAGKNTCRIDSIDLSGVRGCAKIVTVPSGGSGPGGTTPPPGGGAP